MIKVNCDICGKEINDIVEHKFHHYSNINDQIFDFLINIRMCGSGFFDLKEPDLCKDCKIKLVNESFKDFNYDE